MPDIAALIASAERWRKFHRLLGEAGLTGSYEAAHARLVIDCLATAHTRLSLLTEGQLKPLANPVSQAAADQAYLDAVRKLADGLAQALATYEKSAEPRKQQVAQWWKQCLSAPR